MPRLRPSTSRPLAHLLVILLAAVVETADVSPPRPEVTTPEVAIVHASPHSPLSAAAATDTLRLAHTLGSHMVLQQAPLPACLYGQGSPKAFISLTLDGAAVPSATTVVDAMGKWVACLPPQQAGGAHTLTIAGSGGNITLEDVLFGEVWLCAGQSNMQMSVSQALNATAEIAASGREENGGPRLRLMAIGRNTSADPLEDLSSPPLLPWSVATPSSVGGEDWMFFSATCFFYGLHLASKKGLAGTPIGLIQAAYGSTELKAWATPEALTACLSTSPPSTPAVSPPAEQRGGDAGLSGEPQESVNLWPGGPVPSPPIPTADVTNTGPATVAADSTTVAGTSTSTSTSGTNSTKPKEELWPGGPEPSLASPLIPLPAAAAAVAAGAASPGSNRRLLRGLAESDDPVTAAAAAEATAATTVATGTTPARSDPLTPPSSTASTPPPPPPPPAATAAAAAADTGAGAWKQDWRPEATTCFNAMISPLLRMTMRGVIWDQVWRGGGKGGSEGKEMMFFLLELAFRGLGSIPSLPPSFLPSLRTLSLSLPLSGRGRRACPPRRLPLSLPPLHSVLAASVRVRQRPGAHGLWIPPVAGREGGREEGEDSDSLYVHFGFVCV